MVDSTPEFIEFEQAWDGAVDAGGRRVHAYTRTSFEHINHLGGTESFFVTAEDGTDQVLMRYTIEQAAELHAWLTSKLGK